MTLLSGQHSDNLSQTGIIHLELFVQQNWSRFSDEVWALVTVAVENVVRESIPVELFRFPVASSSRSGSTVASRESVASGAGVGVGMNDSGGSMTSAVVESPLNVQHAIFKCGIHLVVLQFMRDLCLDSDDPAVDVIASIVDGGRQQQQLPVDVRPITALPSELFRRVPREFRCRWIACLHASHAFAHTFNANQPLRMALWKAGMVKQMPNLIKQESLALAVYLSIAFHCYREEGDASSVAIAETSEETLHASRLTDKAPSLLAPSAIEYRRGDVTLDTIMAETNQLLERFARFAAENTRYQRDIASWSSVVVLVYREALGLEWGSVSEATSKDRATHDSELEPLQSPRPAPSFGRFKREHVPLLFRHAVHLLACGVDRADLRRALAAFLERIADVVGKPAFAELI